MFVVFFVVLFVFFFYVVCAFFVFFFKQKTAYEMRISDWSSDVCSSDLSRHASRMTSQGSPMTAYEELSRTFTRLRALQEAAGVLQWDMSAMMPSGGAEARTEQLDRKSVV